MTLVTPLWSQLRIAGNSMSGKVASVIPFLGYILISQELISTFLTTGKYGISPLPSVLSVQSIYITYFGMCIFGFGCIVFQLFCSPIIKLYENDDVYVLSTSSITSVYDLIERLTIIKSSPGIDDEKRDRSNKMLNALNIGMSQISSDVKHFTLREFYRLQDKRYPFARMSTTILMTSGIILLSIPTANTFFKIVHYVIQSRS